MELNKELKSNEELQEMLAFLEKQNKELKNLTEKFGSEAAEYKHAFLRLQEKVKSMEEKTKEEEKWKNCRNHKKESSKR